jgi:hypothetical protein
VLRSRRLDSDSEEVVVLTTEKIFESLKLKLLQYSNKSEFYIYISFITILSQVCGMSLDNGINMDRWIASI